MIRITQLKLPIEHKKQELYEKTAKLLRVAPSEIKQLKIVKQSVDARKKEQILFIYTVDVEVAKEQQILKKVKNNQVSQVKEVPYQFPSAVKNPETSASDHRQRPGGTILRSDVSPGRLPPDSSGTRSGRGTAAEGCGMVLEYGNFKHQI